LIATLVKFLFIGVGLGYIAGGLLFWFFREGAGSESPTHYWFWFSRGPYIRSADGRVEHVAFMSKALLACGTPILVVGIFSPDVFLEAFGIVGVGALILLSIILDLIFAADAADRDEYADEGVDEEEIEEIRERD
jgi:hypothetical protein